MVEGTGFIVSPSRLSVYLAENSERQTALECPLELFRVPIRHHFPRRRRRLRPPWTATTDRVGVEARARDAGTAVLARGGAGDSPSARSSGDPVTVDRDLAEPWPLDRSVVFLNHGSFGACPREVLRHQAALRQEMETQPVRFLSRELDDRLDAARGVLAAFVGADADDLAFVSNATSGVNAVLRSLTFSQGDEVLTTDHCYPACRNTLTFVAGRAGAQVVVAKVPFPAASADEIVDAVMRSVTSRTRLALLDHITSPTALVLPIERLIAELGERHPAGALALPPGVRLDGHERSDPLASSAESDRLPRLAPPRRLARSNGAKPRAGARGAAAPLRRRRHSAPMPG